MKRIVLFTLFIFLYQFPIEAQLLFPKKKKEKQSLLIPAKSILGRFNIGGLLDPMETNFSIGSEYLISQKNSIALDAGFITFSRISNDIEKVSGFIIRPSFRNYLGNNNRFYTEIELHFKYAFMQLYGWLGKNCVNGVPAYEQLQNFTLQKGSKGMHLKVGTLFKLDNQAKFLMDWYLGAGARITNYTIKNQPQACYSFAQLFNTINAPDDSLIPVLVFGFRLAYKLR